MQNWKNVIGEVRTVVANNSKMPLKKTNKKPPVKNKLTNCETRKKPPECFNIRTKESGTDESSSDELYLEDYSTESENYTSESDISQEFSDEDKLMEYYEKKLREHCIVGNIDSCSTENDYDDGSPSDTEEQNNKHLVTNKMRNPHCYKTPVTDSQQPVVNSGGLTVTATGKNINRKLPLTIPANRKMSAVALSNNTSAHRHGEDSRSYESSFENDEVTDCSQQSQKYFDEPSSSRVTSTRPLANSSRPRSSSVAEKNQQFNSNKKVIDHLNQMDQKGLVEMKEQIGRRTKPKGGGHSITDEIHSSTKDHILKNYVSSFVDKKNSKKIRKNVKKSDHSTSTSESESELSGRKLTKDVIVDRILTSSLSGSTKKSLKNLLK